MQPRRNALATLIKISLSTIFALGFVAQIQAQDKKIDGTWTWTAQGRNGEERKMTLKLKTEADKLTGVLISPGRDNQTTETKITDAKVKGDEVSFTVTREFNGNKFTMKYNGKVTGDTIKGKIESEGRDGQTRSRDWEAKRKTDAK